MSLTDDCKNDRGGVWVNIYKEEDKNIFWTGSTGYSTEEIAKHNICDKHHKIATIDIKAAIENYNELQRLEEENKRFREGLEDVAYCKTWFYQNDPGSLVTWALEALGAIGGLSPTEILAGKLSTKPYESRLASQNEQLHQLLKECKKVLEWYAQCKCSKSMIDKEGIIFEFADKANKALTRINEVLK